MSVRTCPSGCAGCLLDSVLLEVLGGHRWEWGWEWSDQNNLLPPAYSFGQLLNGRKPELILYWVKVIFWDSEWAQEPLQQSQWNGKSQQMCVFPHFQEERGKVIGVQLVSDPSENTFLWCFIGLSAMGKKEKYIVRGVWETSGACHALKVEVKSQRVFQEL